MQLFYRVAVSQIFAADKQKVPFYWMTLNASMTIAWPPGELIRLPLEQQKGFEPQTRADGAYADL